MRRSKNRIENPEIDSDSRENLEYLNQNGKYQLTVISVKIC